MCTGEPVARPETKDQSTLPTQLYAKSSQHGSLDNWYSSATRSISKRLPRSKHIPKNTRLNVRRVYYSFQKGNALFETFLFEFARAVALILRLFQLLEHNCKLFLGVVATYRRVDSTLILCGCVKREIRFIAAACYASARFRFSVFAQTCSFVLLSHSAVLLPRQMAYCARFL